MEERKFSPEQSEEVIELLDIVDQSASEDAPERAHRSDPSGQSPAEETENGRTVDAGTEGSEADDVLLLDDDAVVRDVKGGAEVMLTSAAENENSSDLSSDSEQIPEREERSAQDETTEQKTEENSQPVQAEAHRADIRELEEKIAALEKANRELAENVESLSQQLAHVGTMFLEDASVRLNMEEIVSRMLDARLPVPSEQELDEASDNREKSLNERVDALEKRMNDEEAQSEQRAAAAAARVIRDEIAAMKAEALHASC